MNTTLPESILTKKQVKTYGPRAYTENGRTMKILAKVRYDDECGNGHNSFAVTCDMYEQTKGNRWVEVGWGAAHEEIVKHFPELKPFIKWHLVSSDGPIHYIANTLYNAGNRDHWGLLKGEASTNPKHQESRIKFPGSPITHKIGARFLAWIEAATKFNKSVYIHGLKKQNPKYVYFEPVPVPHINKSGDTYKFSDKYTFKGYDCQWHECPFDNLREAEEWSQALKGPFEILQFPTLFGEGKERNLDHARDSAVWPEATDEELCLPPDELTAKLEARLPKLMEEFKAAVESLGFVY